MKQIIITILSLSTLVTVSSAQEAKIKQGDRMMENLSYAEAIENYKISLKQGADSADLAKKMASSYYEIRDPKNAEPWYSMVIQNDPEPSDYLRYAEVLKGNGKFEEANTYMTSYSEIASVEGVAKPTIKNTTYYEKLRQESDRFIIKNLDQNTEMAEFSPLFYGEQLVFVSSRTSSDLERSRTHKWNNEPFLDLFIGDVSEDGQLENVSKFSKKVNSKYHEGPMTCSKDLSVIYFTRNNYSGKTGESSDKVVKLKIYSSHKTEAGWSKPEEFAYNSDEYSVGHPSLSADGRTLYFASDMPGGKGGTDLYVCSKNGDGSWSQPQNLGDNINTPKNELFPFIHANGNMYFSSEGHNGMGGLDVFETERKSYGFRVPTNLKSPINSTVDDFGFVLNQLSTSGYVSSNRSNGKGNDDIYYFTMKPEVPTTLSGALVNQNQHPIKKAQVRLVDSDNNIIETKSVDGSGVFEFELDRDYDSYNVQVLEGTEWTDFISDYTPDKSGENDLGEIPITEEIEEEEEEKEPLIRAEEESALAELEGFLVTFTEKETGKVMTKTTNANGLVDVTLDKEKNYTVTFEKPGYPTKTGEVIGSKVTGGVVDIRRFTEPMFVEAPAAKELVFENILYDYDQSGIRRDARNELDKIVKLLREYPRIIIEMGSHTDSRGNASYNMALSQKRAKAAAKYIMSKGIAAERVTWKGYGETKLLNNCLNGTDCSEQQHQENRRTEFTVIGYANEVKD